MKQYHGSSLIVLLCSIAIATTVMLVQAEGRALSSAIAERAKPPLTPKRPKQDERIVRGSLVQFKWKRMKGADTHELVVARDAELEDVAFRIEVSGKQITLDNLLAAGPTGIYFWAVRARTDGQFGAFGDVASFKLVLAEPLTRDDAIARVRDVVLGPFARTKFAAFMADRPLGDGDTVCPQVAHQESAAAEGLVTLAAPTWFAFVDLVPEAKFAHDVRFVFVDAETGEVVVRNEEWWPVVNGSPIYETDLVRAESADRFEPQAPPLEREIGPSVVLPSVSPRLPVPVRPQRVLPLRRRDHVSCNRSVVDKVAVVVQGGGEAAMANDADNMEAVLRGAGFQTSRFTAGVDPLTGVQQFIRTIGMTLEPCDKFVLYISSHGIRSGVFYNPTVGTPDRRTSDWPYSAADPNSVSAILSAVKAGHITLIVDACHSGGVFPELETAFANNAEVELNVITGANASEESLMVDRIFSRWDFSVFTKELVDRLSSTTFDENGDGFVDAGEFCEPLAVAADNAGRAADDFADEVERRRPKAQRGISQLVEAVVLDFPLLDPLTSSPLFSTGAIVTLDRISGGRRGNPESGCASPHLHDDPADGIGILVTREPGSTATFGPFPDPAPFNCGYGRIVTVRRFVFASRE